MGLYIEVWDSYHGLFSFQASHGCYCHHLYAYYFCQGPAFTSQGKPRQAEKRFGFHEQGQKLVCASSSTLSCYLGPKAGGFWQFNSLLLFRGQKLKPSGKLLLLIAAGERNLVF